MYIGKGFVLNVIGIEALLATYCQLKTHFLPLWIQNGLPMASHWLPNWVPIGYQLVANRTPIVPQSYYDRAPIGVRFGIDNGQNGNFNRP